MALGRELRCIKLHEKFPHTAFAGHSKSHISNHAGVALEKEAPPLSSRNWRQDDVPEGRNVQKRGVEWNPTDGCRASAVNGVLPVATTIVRVNPGLCHREVSSLR